jgi:hypothetical protein
MGAAARGSLVSSLQAGGTQVITGQTDQDVRPQAMFPMFHMGGWGDGRSGYWSIVATVVIMRRGRSARMLAAVEPRARHLPLCRAHRLRVDARAADLRELRPVVRCAPSGAGTAYMPREQIERITRAFSARRTWW